MEADDGAKIAIYYVEEWLRRVEGKINAQDERFNRLEKRVGQLAESGYVSREQYDIFLKAQTLACEARHAPLNVAIDNIKAQQNLWSGNAQIVRWLAMVTVAAGIVYLINRIPWP